LPLAIVLDEPAIAHVIAPTTLADEYAMLVQHMIENTYLNGEVVRLDGSLRMPGK